MSSPRTCIRKVTKFLDRISDEGTFYISKRRGGHQRLVAFYGGQKRSFTVPSPAANSQCEKNLENEVNRFVSSLHLDSTPRFNF